MKTFLKLLILIFAFQTANANTFWIDIHDSTKTVTPGESVTLEAYIHNLSDQGIVFMATRTTNDIPDDWTTTICLGKTCYSPSTNQAVESIAAGDSLFFDITFNTSENPGYGEALMVFTDVGAGVSDSVLFSVTSELQPAFSVFFDDTLSSGKAGEELADYGTLYNLTDSLITVYVVRENENLPAGWSTSLCFDTCATPEIDTLTAAVEAGDSLEFSVHFFTGDDAGQGYVDLSIFVEGSPDTFFQTLHAETQSTDIAGAATFNPGEFYLFGNFPNPFNNSTSIRFYAPAKILSTTLSVFNVSGQLVAQIRKGATGAGVHTIRFNAQELSSGLYFYRISVRSLSGQVNSGTGKFLLIK